MSDPFDLQRFVTAQNGVIEVALTELRRGRKTSHWMWFVFPQLAGLGRSPTAVHFALSGPAEARAYLAHPVLGPRLLAAIDALLSTHGRDAVAILGEIDAIKLRSSITLFAAIGDGSRFRAVLDRFFGGAADPATLALLG